MQYCDSSTWTGLKSGPTLTDGLVLWLKLDETSGTTVTDETGNNSGSLCTDKAQALCNPQWAPTSGRFGGALYLDGSYDNFSVPASREYSTLPRTVSLWIKPEWLASTRGTDIEFIRFQTSGGAPWYQFTFRVSFWSSPKDKIRFTIMEYDASTSKTVNSDAPVTTDDWFHLAAVIEPNHTMKLYINGTLQVNTATINTGELANNTQPIYFGSGAYSGNEMNFKGWMDDIRIYSRALSSTEISALYNGG